MRPSGASRVEQPLAFAGGPVEIEFVCDKALDSVERRQLALIAVSVGLEPR